MNEANAERDYLESYRPGDYPSVALTADLVVFAVTGGVGPGRDGGKACAVRRQQDQVGNGNNPHPGVAPGGAVRRQLFEVDRQRSQVQPGFLGQLAAGGCLR